LERNDGFAKAMNLAVARATGEMVLCLNPDAAVSAVCIARLMRVLHMHDGPVFLAGMLRTGGHVQVDAYMLWYFSVQRLLKRQRCLHYLARMADAGRPFPVAKVSGAALFAYRADLLRLGPFDERFFLYGEDVDLSLRASDLGFDLLGVPEAVVEHIGASSADQFGSLVERARTDAAIRLVGYRLGYGWSLLARIEILFLTLLGAPIARWTSSPGSAARLARLSELRRWGLARNVDKLVP